jgi:hypothetical protein
MRPSLFLGIAPTNGRKSMKVKNFIKIIQTWAVPRFQSQLPLWCFPERHLRFKAYCVGAFKTGTTTIPKIFSQQYRATHQPEIGLLYQKILELSTGKINESEFASYIKHRERRLGLEMDSSGLNYFFVNILLSEFSEAKFILTIRDCYSWLDSFMDQQYQDYCYVQANHPFRKNRAMKVFDIFFRADEFKHAKEEKVLADNGLHTLDGYFSYWREHNSKVLATVPEKRLLVVKTQEIDQSIRRIEEFLGITPGTLPNNVREHVRRKKSNIISQIDKDFLEEKANFHCKELMDKYFPEVKGFNS